MAASISLVSVIIPVFNHARTLPRVIRSVAQQTHRPLEIIIVDDGSADAIGAALEEVQKITMENDLPATVIRQKNQGANAARNAGARVAKGEYIIFWDADTLADARLVAKMLSALETHPAASYAYCQFRFGWKKIRSHFFDASLLRRVNYIDITSLVRRSDLMPFDENLRRFQDWDLWLSLLARDRSGIFIPQVLYRKIVGSRVGISSWLPRFAFHLPWKSKKIRAYEAAREVIVQKHGLR